MTHGASAYVNHGCRCPICTAANTARVREYRERRTNAMTSGGDGTTRGTTEKRPRVAPTTGGMAHEEVPS